MKTMLSVLGTILLVGALALAQSTSGASGKSSAKKSSASSSASNTDSSNSGTTPNSAVQAGNSGFDTSGSSQTPAASSGTNSGQSGSSAGSSASDTSSTSAQDGSSGAQSISNGPVAETVSDSSALIGWSTRNAASNTGLKYGTNRANLTETAQGTDGGDGKNHHARLQGLTPSTRYYFQVTENGEQVGGVGTFKTTASGETPVQSKAIIPQK